MKTLLLALCIGLVSMVSAGGVVHFDSQKLAESYEPLKKAETDLQNFQAKLTQQLQGIQKEYQMLASELQQTAATMDEFQLENKKLELEQIGQRYQMAEQSYQQKLASKQQAIMMPLTERLRQALEALAKENGYDYILDKLATSYANPSKDITDKVIAKLKALTPAN